MAIEPNDRIHSEGVPGERTGEVRAKAKLTNAVDEALVRRGMLRADQIRTYEADALVDT